MFSYLGQVQVSQSVGCFLSIKTVVVSGITSSVGIHLASQLVEKGYRVRGFARKLDRAPRHSSIELVQADLLDSEKMEEICSGCIGVIHLAALSSPWGNFRDFYQINVEGTRSLLRAAEGAQVKRFVHVSTPSLYFDYSDRFDISEASALPRKSVNAYSATKRLAEQVVDGSLIETITVRPRAIFGPHDQALLPRLLKVCEERGIPCFRNQSPWVDVTYVDNVAHALCLALEAPSSCAGEKYNITNGEPIELWTLLDRLLKKLSIPSRFWKVPYPIAMSAAWMSEQMSKLTGKEPLLTRYAVGVMSHSQTLSIEKAKKELKYSPIITLEEGIQRYVRWHQTA